MAGQGSAGEVLREFENQEGSGFALGCKLQREVANLGRE